MPDIHITLPLTEETREFIDKNLEGMKEFCVDLFVDLISSIPILVPVLAVILIVVFFIRKKLAGRKMKKMVKNLDAGLKGTDNGNEK